MPFGLTNAPALFQALENDFLNHSVFVYQHNILIFFKNPEEHIFPVQQVLQRLLVTKLYVKAENCEFHGSSVLFLA